MGPPRVTVRQASPHHKKKRRKKIPSKLIKLNVMNSKRLASPIMGIFCGGLNAYCMQTRPLFLRCGSCGSFATCVFRICNE